MTQPAGGQGGDDDLQFSTVEPAAPNQAAVNQTAPLQTQAQVCAACKQPILNYYYTVRDQIICGNCREQVAAMFQSPGAAGIARATIYGLVAGIAGALVWFAVLYMAKAQLGIIAVAVGYLVGKAVRKGSGRAGGMALQIIAVAITYLSVGLNYVLVLVKVLKDEAVTIYPTPKLVTFLVQELFTLPVRWNLTNPIGLLIVGFALWEAWKLSSPARLVISGPFSINPSMPPAGSGT